MELDDFKSTWNDMNHQVKLNPNFNLNKFDKMNQSNFQSRLKKILLPEILGSLVCIGSAVYIGINFSRLDSITFQFIGVFTMLLLVVLSIISVMSILPLYKIADLNKSYSETLQKFAEEKKNFFKLQKINLLLNYVLLVAVIILSTRLFGRNEITDNKQFFVFAFILGWSFFLIFSKWVAKNYKKQIRAAEDLLKELSA